MSGAKSSAPLIDDTDNPVGEIEDAYLGCEMLEMRPTQFLSCDSQAQRNDLESSICATSASRPQQLCIGSSKLDCNDALLQEIDGRASPLECRTPDISAASTVRSPKPHNTFQTTRRTSKRYKSYSYKDFLPEWTVQPSDEQTFKLVQIFLK